MFFFWCALCRHLKWQDLQQQTYINQEKNLPGCFTSLNYISIRHLMILTMSETVSEIFVYPFHDLQAVHCHFFSFLFIFFHFFNLCHFFSFFFTKFHFFSFFETYFYFFQLFGRMLTLIVEFFSSATVYELNHCLWFIIYILEGFIALLCVRKMREAK